MDRLVRLFPKLDFWLYLAFSLACVAYAARTFYGYMHVQTGGEWSAPLDDVFIHFDYARATARGYPFQWSEGNGFSSGNTSLSYPFVLAVGYLVGFRGMLLMQWAAIVACASIAIFLVATARALEPLGRWAKYLLPPVALSVGALDWSLFSGMENAFHLAWWALTLGASLDVIRAAEEGRSLVRWSFVAGLAGAFLFLTRPESAVCVAAFAVWTALTVRSVRRRKQADAASVTAHRESAESAASSSSATSARAVRFPWGVMLAMGIPAAMALVAQAIANRVYTGEWAAAGAIAKLALNHPYMTASDKWDQYTELLRYVVLRNTHHHFADFDPKHPIPWGWLVPLVALLPLFARPTSASGGASNVAPERGTPVAGDPSGGTTDVARESARPIAGETSGTTTASVRGIAAMLWVQVIAWLALVSLNGQVRWQNERYTMPAVAWLLVLAAMGLATLAGGAWRKAGAVARPERSRLVFAAIRIGGAAALALLFYRAQVPRMRDQIWFFGRASRNIRDQHVVAGRLLKRMGAERVLVGDAGALIYASDRPAIDLIGLGGFRDLPFARAGVHGLGASIELLERLSPEDRPDVMALYPGWWGDLPTIFGRRITSVPVFGNVICGGSEKVIYRADWSALDRAGRPRLLRDHESVVDEVDVADLVSEKAHGYTFPHPAGGFVDFRVLADPEEPDADLFDAGRVIAPGQSETMKVTLPSGPRRLVLRAPPEMKAKIEVRIDGKPAGAVVLSGVPERRGPRTKRAGDVPPGAWAEAALTLPSSPPGRVELTLAVVEGAFLDAHVWIVSSDGAD